MRYIAKTKHFHSRKHWRALNQKIKKTPAQNGTLRQYWRLFTLDKKKMWYLYQKNTIKASISNTYCQLTVTIFYRFRTARDTFSLQPF